MNGDDRYTTFVAEADGKIIGLVTMVTALAIGHPNGYTKINVIQRFIMPQIMIRPNMISNAFLLFFFFMLLASCFLS